jgi:hypothetical protein
LNFREAQKQAHQEANNCRNSVVVVMAPRIDHGKFSTSPDEYETMTETAARRLDLEFRYTAAPGTTIYADYVLECEAADEPPMDFGAWKREGSLSLADWQAKQAAREEARLTPKAKKKPAPAPKAKAEPSSRPNSGVTKRVWEIADSLTNGSGTINRSAVLAACVDAGINPATASTQFSKWRKSKLNA